MYIFKQEIIIALMLLTCGIGIGAIKSVSDIIKLLCSRKFFRILIDIAILFTFSILFIYIVFITCDFDIKLTNIVMIVMGYVTYSIGPQRLLHSTLSKMKLRILNAKQTKAFHYLFK